MADPTQALFFYASKTGDLVGAGASANTVSLQLAYNNSTEPEILTDATRGSVAIRRGSASDTDKLVSFQNGAGAETGSVNGEGHAIFTQLIKSGGTASQFLKANGSVDSNIYSRLVSAPASATSSGTAGQFAYDSTYVYVCVATNTWKRAKLANW